jgi:hypothetical protein
MPTSVIRPVKITYTNVRHLVVFRKRKGGLGPIRNWSNLPPAAAGNVKDVVKTQPSEIVVNRKRKGGLALSEGMGCTLTSSPKTPNHHIFRTI